MQRRSHRRTRCARLSLAALPLLAGMACGGSTSEPTPVPDPTPPVVKPVRVVIVTSPLTTGGPETAAGEFVVRVEDAAGKGVAGVRVVFSGQTGRPLMFAPRDTTSDSTGVARSTVTFGPVAGSDRLLATADGVADPAKVDVTVTPGPAAYVSLSVASSRLYGAGDTTSFQVFVVDNFLNWIATAPIDFQVSDSTLLAVTAPAALDTYGTIRALRGGGSATVTATSGAKSNVFTIGVLQYPRLACAGIAPAQDLDFGVLATASDSTFCVGAKDRSAAYALIVYNDSLDGATSLASSVTAYNVVPELQFARVPSRAPSLSRSGALLRRGRVPTLDLRFHERLLTRSRSLGRLFPAARAARSFTGRSAALRPSYSLAGSASATPAVDDLLSLNVAQDPCSNADLRTFRVEAVGTQAIVLADTANPTGGYSRAEYERFAARFDTLVLPLDRDAFGEPTDIDGNGHIAILFTRAVNELTPPNAGSYVGGFFHPRDLFPRAGTSTFAACATSNEGEMFYMIVPDPLGVVNGNQFSRGMVDTLTTGILAHELQHLINAGRRMYVNTAARDFEETWLNEGLSHVAEELLYFRETGYAPRSRLTSQAIIDSRAHFDTWVADDASNFVRFYLYLLDPANNSPIDAGDALETRGATWAFLRFAVDHSFASDAGVWQRFANSTTTGLGTLNVGLQRDPRPLLHDFAITNFAGSLPDPRFVHPSWNYYDVYTQVFTARTYPQPMLQLEEATPMPVTARGGAASYYRFVVPGGVQALLKFGSSEARPDRNLSFMLLRL